MLPGMGQTFQGLLVATGNAFATSVALNFSRFICPNITDIIGVANEKFIETCICLYVVVNYGRVCLGFGFVFIVCSRANDIFEKR